MVIVVEEVEFGLEAEVEEQLEAEVLPLLDLATIHKEEMVVPQYQLPSLQHSYMVEDREVVLEVVEMVLLLLLLLVKEEIKQE